MSILAVRNLSKAFGGVRAVDDVRFDIAEGEFAASSDLSRATSGASASAARFRSPPPSAR